jgi:ATP-dependent RNA helicase RhlB
VPPQEGLTRFHDLNLRDEIMRAVFDLGFQYCTPVQAKTIPAVMAGRDVTGRAQTGTGKTAAFLIQIFQRFLNTPMADRRPGSPRALILAPTRELVMQIVRDAEALGKYCPFRTVAVYGGSALEQQRRDVERYNPEIVAATPGRLIDFANRRTVDLSRVEILVIDEADRMLDMGFIPDVRRIVYSTPHKDKRQTMFFSATLTDSVTRLATSWTRDPAHVEIDPEQVTVDTINQIVYIVTTRQKFPLLVNILRHEHLQRVLLFANRRDTAARLEGELKRAGIDCGLISGALPQDKRTRTLEAFREGRVRVLVATDVASRGLHIDDIGHVINFNIPQDPEDYVHRIGRTGRAGARGTSITFACEDEAMDIPAVEAFIGRPLPCTHPPEEWLKL